METNLKNITCDVAVIGGGPAGLAAAVAAKENGAQKVLIVERDTSLGGILQQCIHPGFGLTRFKEELTGPEYAAIFEKQTEEAGVEVLTDAMVLEVSANTAVCSTTDGIITVTAGSIVLAMGCRERTRGNIRIPGTRPAGIYTAGAAQRLINRQNCMVGKQVIILGSGDIGMIMARRMTLEGAKVQAVVELMPYLAGLIRNRVQCLDDFGIPLMLSHTVTRIVGNERVEGVYVAQVDENKNPITETEKFFRCDTLLLSVGLVPENELTRTARIEMNSVTSGPMVNQYMQTSIPSVFACGNVVHVNDLADNVSLESAVAGAQAARYVKGELPQGETVKCVAGTGVRYVCPHRLTLTEEDVTVSLYFRVLAPDDSAVTLRAFCGDKVLAVKKVRRVSPGEMENLRVKLTEVTGDVTIEVVKEA